MSSGPLVSLWQDAQCCVPGVEMMILGTYWFFSFSFKQAQLALDDDMPLSTHACMHSHSRLLILKKTVNTNGICNFLNYLLWNYYCYFYICIL